VAGQCTFGTWHANAPVHYIGANFAPGRGKMGTGTRSTKKTNQNLPRMEEGEWGGTRNLKLRVLVGARDERSKGRERHHTKPIVDTTMK